MRGGSAERPLPLIREAAARRFEGRSRESPPTPRRMKAAPALGVRGRAGTEGLKPTDVPKGPPPASGGAIPSVPRGRPDVGLGRPSRVSREADSASEGPNRLSEALCG